MSNVVKFEKKKKDDIVDVTSLTCGLCDNRFFRVFRIEGTNENMTECTQCGRWDTLENAVEAIST